MFKTRPFRFGALLQQPLAGLDWPSTARKLEDLGYATLVLPDHFHTQHAPGPALAAAAAATTELRIGTLMYCNDYRHPVVLAKEVATLDVISQGRFEFGIGAGWMTTDYEQSGMALDPASVRIDRMVEALDVIEGLLGEGEFSHEGRHYRIEGLDGFPKPVQSRVPVVIGGGGPRMLAAAARHADVVGVNANLRSGTIDDNTIDDLTAQRFDTKLGWVQQSAAERAGEIELNVLVNFASVTADEDETRSTVSAVGEMFHRTAETVSTTPTVLIGTTEHIARTLIERRERWGFSYIVLHGNGSDFESFAPVISELSGN